VAARYEAELRLCVEGGKLIEAEGWGNVARHCLVQASAAEALATLLRLGARERTRLARTAASHDWRKRLDKRPGHFTTSEVERANRLCAEVEPDAELMRATHPRFLPVFFSGEATLLQMIQFYIDDITRNDEIVRLVDRIVDVQQRDPSPDPAVDEMLGRSYWEAERIAGDAVEALLFSILGDFGVGIDRPENIPLLIASLVPVRPR